MDAEMHLARKSFRNRRKLRRNGIRRTKSTSITKTTTRLQIRPRTVKQSFRHTLGTTTEHLQPVICNTVGHSTTIRKETIYARLRTTDERDGRYRRGTRNETTMRYTTSTTSVYIDVKFTTTTSPTRWQHPPLPAAPRQTLRRLTPEEVMQPTKAQKTSKDTATGPTEQATNKPQPLRQKVNAVTLHCPTEHPSLPTQTTTPPKTNP